MNKVSVCFDWYSAAVGCCAWNSFTVLATLNASLRVLEPVILFVLSFLPISFYLECKFFLFFVLVCPRFGVLEKVEEKSELIYDNYVRGGLQRLNDQLRPIRLGIASSGLMDASKVQGDVSRKPIA